MKQTKRRLLSLLMAFAILCTMIPAAFAAEETPGGTGETDPSTGSEVTNPDKEPGGEPTTPGGEEETPETPTAVEHTSSHKLAYNSNNDGKTHTVTCTVENCDFEEKDNEKCTSADGYEEDSEYHWQICEHCDQVLNKTAHTPSGWKDSADHTEHVNKCTVCGYEISAEPHKWKWTEITDTTHTGYCTVSGCDESVTKEEHTFGSDGKCTLCKAQNKGEVKAVTLAVSGSSHIGVGDKASLKVTAYSDTDKKVVTQYNKDDLTFESDSNNVRISGTEVIGRYPGTAKVRAVINGEQSNWVTLTVEATEDLEVTISESLETYTFDDDNTLEGDSLYDQLDDALADIADYDYYEDLTFSISSGNTSIGTIDYSSKYDSVSDFGDVEFTIKKAGTFTADYTVKEGSSTILSGKIVIKVEEGGSAGDVIYTAVVDDDVDLDADDFEDFWEDEYSKGTLEYVTFEKVNSRYGALVDGDGDKLSSSDKCYVDAKSKQVGLDEVTFEPKKGYTGAVTIGFTAHGTTSSSSRSKDLPGTLVILYTENEPKAITYSVTGDAVTLDGDDFLANYKDAMGSSASSLQVKFLDVPTNGTLYYNYNEKTGKGTELTSKNIGTYTFSTSSRASRSLEDVTYVPDSKGRSDTVKFACYTSGGDLRYYGEVTFGVTVKDVTVSLTSTSSGVTFNSADFFGVSSDMLSVTYLTFGAPSSGTLYKNWTGVTGTKVTTSDKFAYVSSISGYTSLGTVTYVPAAGYSGTVTIPFSAYTTGGTVISGKVSIKVTATATVSFTDVPTTGSQAWAYPYINRLASAGVVGGITPTTYGPKQQVKWGEVLKMVLLGAGHPTQVEGTGANWAANYLTYAYQKGIVSSNKIDLSKPITRLEMAELAAKALGLSAESSIKTGIIGPTDTTNGYVYALYNRGIVGGDSSSGKNLYNPNSTLLRDEMAKIVCGVMDNA